MPLRSGNGVSHPPTPRAENSIEFVNAARAGRILHIIHALHEKSGAVGAEFSMRGAMPFFIFPTARCYREGTPEAQNKYGAVQFNTEVRSRFARNRIRAPARRRACSAKKGKKNRVSRDSGVPAEMKMPRRGSIIARRVAFGARFARPRAIASAIGNR